jgi:hypothetical protein
MAADALGDLVIGLTELDAYPDLLTIRDAE